MDLPIVQSNIKDYIHPDGNKVPVKLLNEVPVQEYFNVPQAGIAHVEGSNLYKTIQPVEPVKMNSYKKDKPVKLSEKTIFYNIEKTPNPDNDYNLSKNMLGDLAEENMKKTFEIEYARANNNPDLEAYELSKYEEDLVPPVQDDLITRFIKEKLEETKLKKELAEREEAKKQEDAADNEKKVQFLNSFSDVKELDSLSDDEIREIAVKFGGQGDEVVDRKSSLDFLVKLKKMLNPPPAPGGPGGPSAPSRTSSASTPIPVSRSSSASGSSSAPKAGPNDAYLRQFATKDLTVSSKSQLVTNATMLGLLLQVKKPKNIKDYLDVLIPYQATLQKKYGVTTIAGSGVRPYTKNPDVYNKQWTLMGHLLLSKSELDKNVLVVRNGVTKTFYADIPKCELSPEAASVLKAIMNGDLSIPDYSTLSYNERNILNKIIKRSKLGIKVEKTRKLPELSSMPKPPGRPKRTQREFKMVLGEILAGNDSIVLLNQLKSMAPDMDLTPEQKEMVDAIFS